MTICAAAHCMVLNQPAIFTISDRMLTSADIEFESGRVKIYNFNPVNALCLFAGEETTCAAIATEVHASILESGIINVTDVANLFGSTFAEHRRRRAEETYLAPLGLDLKSFLSSQTEMSSDVVGHLTQQLLDAELSLEVIIAGWDATPPVPRIYHVGDPGRVTLCDGIGYCSIGSGSRQFETVLMTSMFNRNWPLPKTQLLLYSAKKKAELSPGVGSSTDICVIKQDALFTAPPNAIVALEEHYRSFSKLVAKAIDDTITSIVKDERLCKLVPYVIGPDGKPVVLATT